MNLKSKVIALGLAGAVALVPIYEGVMLKWYKDPVGIITDCIGHTGKGVRALNTRAQCDEKLYEDLLVANQVVESCVAVPLNDNQRSAFVSFAFNVGPGRKNVKDGFCVLKNGFQPSFLRHLNAGRTYEACKGLTQWVNAGGKPLRGLVLRREAEFQLCIKEPT